jgi:hypothetical protein
MWVVLKKKWRSVRRVNKLSRTYLDNINNPNNYKSLWLSLFKACPQGSSWSWFSSRSQSYCPKMSPGCVFPGLTAYMSQIEGWGGLELSNLALATRQRHTQALGAQEGVARGRKECVGQEKRSRSGNGPVRGAGEERLGHSVRATMGISPAQAYKTRLIRLFPRRTVGTVLIEEQAIRIEALWRDAHPQ